MINTTKAKEIRDETERFQEVAKETQFKRRDIQNEETERNRGDTRGDTEIKRAKRHRRHKRETEEERKQRYR